MVEDSGERVQSVSRIKCTILVVEDDPAILNSMRIMLSSDYHLLLADSAEAGIDILRNYDCSDDGLIEIVVSDQQLPGMQGIDFLHWVRNESPRSIRILTTGDANFGTAVGAINGGLVHRFLIKPWHPSNLMPLIADAAKKFILERSHEELLDRLRVTNNQLEHRVTERTRELKEALEKLESKNAILQKMALTDVLTEMPNRRAMDQLARMEMVRRARNPSPLSLAMIDADHFKDINTRYLLPGGDHVLRWLAKRLNASVRSNDSIGRVGGEEFMLISPMTDSEGSMILGERIRRAVAEDSTSYNGERIQITISIGIVVAGPDVLVDYDQLRHYAAAALSEAKMMGRNRCVLREISTYAGPTVS